jgi:hypothetical protein
VKGNGATRKEERENGIKKERRYIVIMKQKTVDQCYFFTLIGKGNRTVAVHKSTNFPDPAQPPVVDVFLITGLNELSQLTSME